MLHITKEGVRVDAKTVGEMPKLSAGHHWCNVAPVGESPEWHEVPGTLESVNINQAPKLFGYDEQEFMARQYKPARKVRYA